MIDELNQAVEEYQKKWRAFLAARSNKTFFEGLQPTSVGWKTTDLADFDQRFAELREQADQIHIGWINERWLATLHLRGTTISGGIQLVKLMQRRPGSSDATGLDHVDFYSSEVANAGSVLTAEPNLKWSHEENGLCKWTSLWFAGTEAKLRTGTTLDVCVAELQEVNRHILGPKT
jgi:hypothetical protein